MKKSFLFFAISFLILNSLFCAKNKWINSNIDGNLLVECPSIKDDFYQAVNYERLKNEQLSSYVISNATNLNKIIENQMLEIFTKEKSEDKDEQLLIDLYNMYLDDSKRNADGIKPILPAIQKIQSIKSLDEFKTSFNDDEIKSFFPISVDLRFNNAIYCVPLFTVDTFFSSNAQQLLEFYEKMFVKVGFDKTEAKRLLQQAFEFEQQYSVNLIENSLGNSLLIASKSYNNIPLKELVEGWGVPSLIHYVFDFPTRFEKFNSLYVEENLEVIKTLCILKLIANFSNCLDKDAEQNKIDFNNQIYGISLVVNRETLAINFLKNNFSDLFGKVWCKNYFSDEIKKDVEKLINEILEEYKKEINSWDWMKTGSKYNLTEFLNKMKVFVGYYDFFDYSDYKISENLYNSVFGMHIYIKQIEAKKCYKNFDADKWLMAPYEYNAYYNDINNSMNILAGYIYGNGYNPDMSIEEKYAAVGVAIAHEISHCFSISTASGSIIHKLSLQDHNALDERITKIADYYSTFEILDGINCNGTFCKGEIGADVFAMQVILEIVKNIPNFDYRLFFESYAENNFYKATEQFIKYLHENDSHPPYNLRVNITVQQFDEFYKTFNIKRKDGMYLKEKERIEF